jgi:hypothetical protein
MASDHRVRNGAGVPPGDQQTGLTLEQAFQLEGVAQLCAPGAVPPAFDYHSPLMSLPFAFQTTMLTIPAAVPYITLSGEKVDRWRRLLGERGQAPRIGLAWSGRPRQGEFRNRPIPLKLPLPLLATSTTRPRSSRSSIS